jgi:hypothetical protein
VRELLWKPDDEKLPIEDRDYYELRLEEFSDPAHLYRVWRTRYEWDEGRHWVAPADHVLEKFKTLAEAEARYALHLKMLPDLGFTVSDMGPMM